MTKLIIFTGTPGSGKSTILERLSEEGVKVVTMSSEMMKVLAAEGKAVDRDKIRMMTADEILNTRVKVVKKLIEEKKDAVIDTHASVKQGNRYVPGFSIDELKSIRVTGLVYIDATSKDILSRRAKDTTRYRGDMGVTEAEIDEHRSINIAILSSFALLLGIPLYVVDNPEGKVDETAQEVKRIVLELFGGLGREESLQKSQ